MESQATNFEPDDDPRLRGDEIPEYLYKADFRMSDNSPTSPSLDGFKAASSGLYPSPANPDAFPSTRLEFELFFEEYCDLLANPVKHDTSTHIHFVGFYTKRALAEKEATLLRANGTTYRVYSVRGDQLEKFGASVVKGRNVFAIGQGKNSKVIHADATVGEEILVWGKVPVEALIGSWGIGEEKMLPTEFPKYRQALRKYLGPVPRAKHVKKWQEMSEEEVFALANTASSEHGHQAVRSAPRQSNATAYHSTPLPASGRPTRRSEVYNQLAASSNPPQEFQTMASAPPPPPPVLNSAAGMSNSNYRPQQSSTHRSPYPGPGQMDGPSDELDDGEHCSSKNVSWGNWNASRQGRIEIPRSNDATVPSAIQSSQLTAVGQNGTVSSTTTDIAPHHAATQQLLSENGDVDTASIARDDIHTFATGGESARKKRQLSDSPSREASEPKRVFKSSNGSVASTGEGPKSIVRLSAPATSPMNGSATVTNQPNIPKGRTPLPSEPRRPTPSLPKPFPQPSSDDEREALREEEYRRKNEPQNGFPLGRAVSSVVSQAPTSAASSKPAPARHPLPTSRPAVPTTGLAANPMRPFPSTSNPAASRNFEVRSSSGQSVVNVPSVRPDNSNPTSAYTSEVVSSGARSLNFSMPGVTQAPNLALNPHGLVQNAMAFGAQGARGYHSPYPVVPVPAQQPAFAAMARTSTPTGRHQYGPRMIDPRSAGGNGFGSASRSQVSSMGHFTPSFQHPYPSPLQLQQHGFPQGPMNPQLMNSLISRPTGGSFSPSRTFAPHNSQQRLMVAPPRPVGHSTSEIMRNLAVHIPQNPPANKPKAENGKAGSKSKPVKPAATSRPKKSRDSQSIQPASSSFKAIFQVPANPHDVHADFEREGIEERNHRMKYLALRHARLRDGRDALDAQQKKQVADDRKKVTKFNGPGTAESPIILDDDEDEEMKYAPAVARNAHSRTFQPARPRTYPFGSPIQVNEEDKYRFEMRHMTSNSRYAPAGNIQSFTYQPTIPRGTLKFAPSTDGQSSPIPDNFRPYHPQGIGRGRPVNNMESPNRLAYNYDPLSNSPVGPRSSRPFNQGFGNENRSYNDSLSQITQPGPKSEKPMLKKSMASKTKFTNDRLHDPFRDTVSPSSTSSEGEDVGGEDDGMGASDVSMFPKMPALPSKQ